MIQKESIKDLFDKACLQMINALKNQREFLDKKTSAFHYANEYKLIYGFICKEALKEKKRSTSIKAALGDNQLVQGLKLVVLNTLLINLRYSYSERKALLTGLL